eukprot:349632-Chlamydomonas_euryale.AAC.22
MGEDSPNKWLPPSSEHPCTCQDPTAKQDSEQHARAQCRRCTDVSGIISQSHSVYLRPGIAKLEVGIWRPNQWESDRADQANPCHAQRAIVGGTRLLQQSINIWLRRRNFAAPEHV